MRTKSLFSILLLGLTFMAVGQVKNQPSYPDTIRINTEENLIITIAMKEMRKKSVGFDDNIWGSILGAMESSILTSGLNGGMGVTYQKVIVGDEEKAKIEVKTFDQESDVFWIEKEGMRHYTSDRIEFLIVFPEITISFTLNDLEDIQQLKNLSIESLWVELEKKEEELKPKRVLYQAKGEVNYGILRINDIKRGDRKDNLELGAGLGLGYYRDQFVPDVSYKASFNFLDPFDNVKYQFGLLYTQHYVLTREAEGEYDLSLNGFLNAFWVKHFSKDYSYGLGFGYLIHKQGNFFKGNTYKISFYTRGSSRTSFTPELVFTDGFRQAFPALRFGVTF